jgi:Na+(H+)/acetate symporter ActP
VVLALTLANIVAVVGLGIFGAVSTFTQPALSRVLLFAVITLAALVVIQRNFTRGLQLNSVRGLRASRARRSAAADVPAPIACDAHSGEMPSTLGIMASPSTENSARKS